MSRVHTQRLFAYPLLLVIAGSLCFGGLGQASLWDIDEGNNAEAAREMLDSGDWVVPTFNYQLRVDKPALLYWLQTACYRWLGVNEFAARLPSALAVLATVLIVFELGRLLFGPAEAVLGGLIFSTSIAGIAAAHFANPDALLNLYTCATLTLFWRSYRQGDSLWIYLGAITSGLGVLAKGPVGLVLPALVITLFLIWNRRLSFLFNRRLLLGLTLFFLVAGPWYIEVGVETKADFLRGFLLTHNLERFLSPMEKHSGPFYYYALALLAGLGTWSIFLGWTVWYGTRKRSDDGPATHDLRSDSYRFVWCWVGVYLLFFSLASTKLPNYILPAYAPLALATAHFLERWRSGQIDSKGVMSVSLTCLVVFGAGLAGALLLVGGKWPADFLRGHYYVSLAPWAILGGVPILGAAGCWLLAKKDLRLPALTSLVATAWLTTGGLLLLSIQADALKAPRQLVQRAEVCRPRDEVRVAAYQYFQPSLVFYCQREVTRIDDEVQLRDFLGLPVRSFVFMPESVWHGLQASMPASAHVLASHFDLYRRGDIVVICNR